jgi:hypothetical protein
MARLLTFKDFPSHVDVRPVTLARCGMYYSGNGDEVICAFCHVHLKNWKTGDCIVSKHQEQSPNCPYLAVSIYPKNVPLKPRTEGLSLKQLVDNFVAGNPSSSISHDTPLYSSLQPTDSSEMEHHCASQTANNFASLNQKGNCYTLSGNGSSVESPQQHAQSLPANLPVSSSNNDDLHTRPPLLSSLYQSSTLRKDGVGQITHPPPPTSQTQIHDSSVHAMRSEATRLETYDRFSLDANVKPADLAKSGFFYVGPSDRVRCAFCNLNLHNWEAGDNPHVEHQRYAPTCPFIRGQDVGNIPISTTSGSAPPGVNQNNLGGEAAGLEGNNVILERPKHPTMAVEATRFNSYKDWPSVAVSQKPEELARAGFYYAGVSDHVKCFFCDGGLRNWEAGDDPWTEHARWFPRCGHVRQSKGEAFIRAVQARYNEQKPVALLGQSSAAQAAQMAGVLPHVTPEQVETEMQRPEVQKFIEMGFSRDVLAKALEKKLRLGGSDSFNTDSLLDAVMEIQNQNEPAERTSPVSRGVSNMSAATASAPAPSTTADTSGKTKKKKRNRGNRVTASDPQPTEEEKEKLQKRIKEIEEQRLCKVCMDAEFNIVFLPCGHLVCCSSCAPALRNCPICRTLIRGTVRTYWS